MSGKRLAILTLFKQGALAQRIITAATEPRSDPDYEMRLRQWATDCVVHALSEIQVDRISRQSVVMWVDAARRLASGDLTPETVGTAADPDLSVLYAEAKRTAFSPRAEIRLAAALAVQGNVYLGASGAATHARKAMRGMLGDRPLELVEFDWQVTRLKGWMEYTPPLPLML
jgi:hypothetical protein